MFNISQVLDVLVDKTTSFCPCSNQSSFIYLFIVSLTVSISVSVFVLNLDRFDISGMLSLIISDLISLRLFVAMFQYFSSCFIIFNFIFIPLNHNNS